MNRRGFIAALAAIPFAQHPAAQAVAGALQPLEVGTFTPMLLDYEEGMCATGWYQRVGAIVRVNGVVTIGWPHG